MNLTKELLHALSREYLNSYYSLNSYIGCTTNCAYCFLAPLGIVPARPVKAISESALVAEALADPLFERGRTVLSLNNRTDPFLNGEVKESTFRLLDAIAEAQLKNPVTITTKGLLTAADCARLDCYDSLVLILIVTYNGIPLPLQPIDHTVQEATIRHAAACRHVRLVHQCRPILPGVNDDERTLRCVFDYASRYCEATIYQGVRVNPFIRKRLRERRYDYKGRMSAQKIKSRTVDATFQQFRQEHPSYPIFDHTSCCLSYLLGQADYNVCYAVVDCPASCPNYTLCHDAAPLPPADVAARLARIGIPDGWTLTDGSLHVPAPLTDAQRSYIHHILHLPCDAAGRRPAFSEMLMEGGDPA